MSNNLAPVRARETACEDWLSTVEANDGTPDSYRRQGFLTGAEWAEDRCGAIHAGEQGDWADERASYRRRLDEAATLMRETAELLRGYEKHHRDQAAHLAAQGTGATMEREQDRQAKADRNALAAARLEAWVDPASQPVQATREVPGEDVMVAHGQVIDLPGVTSREQARRLAHHADPTRFTPVPGFAGLDPEILEALQATAGEAERVTGVVEVVGLPVSKRGGDYEFDGEIRAVIPKRSGEVRYAVEDDRGLLLIMNARQCGLPSSGRRAAPPHRPGGVADLLAFRVQTGDPRFDPLAPVCVNGYLYHPTKEA